MLRSRNEEVTEAVLRRSFGTSLREIFMKKTGMTTHWKIRMSIAPSQSIAFLIIFLFFFLIPNRWFLRGLLAVLAVQPVFAILIKPDQLSTFFAPYIQLHSSSVVYSQSVAFMSARLRSSSSHFMNHSPVVSSRWRVSKNISAS